MELHRTICVLLLFFITSKKVEAAREKDEHTPPLHLLTFRRDSVEHIPDHEPFLERSGTHVTLYGYGTRHLPLRAAIESVPDINEASKRLPLRDAVEKRPPPDEPFDPDVEELPNFIYYNSKPSGQLDLYESGYNNHKGENIRTLGTSYYTAINPSGKLDFSEYNNQELKYSAFNGFYNDAQQLIYPNQYIYIPNDYLSNLPSNFYQKQDKYYSQQEIFEKIFKDYRSAVPYRVDNPYQRLLTSRIARKADIETKKTEKVNEEKIVCYVQGTSAYRKEPLAFNPEDLDPFICTHVIYFYASIDPLGFHMISNDEAYDIVQGGYRAATRLKSVNPDLKVLISLGGSREDGSHRFSNMVSSSRKRRTFIRSAISFIKQYQFDGMEIHWEYPGAEELGGKYTDKHYLELFLEELSEIFKTRGWLLVVSAPSSRFRIEDGFEPATLGNSVDFVNIQTYDFHKDREPVVNHPANLFPKRDDNDLDLFLSVDYAVRFWKRKGLPNSKIVVGIPFFGRSFTLQSVNDSTIGSPIKGPGKEGFYTQLQGLLAYFEICEMVLNQGWLRSKDDSGSHFIVNGDQWVGYDNPESITEKISYIKDQKLGGVNVFAADMDDFKGLCGEKWPLLTTINRELKGTTPTNFQEDRHTAIKPFGTCASNGYYSDSKNCAAYYICKNGLSYHLSCGINQMFNPKTAKCDTVNPQNCRPGNTIYIPSNLKEINMFLRREDIRENKPKVVCYMTNWAFYRKSEGKFVPEHIDQRLCTYIIYAFASLHPEKLLIKEFDTWADIDNNLYHRVSSLKDSTVLLSVGGWTDSAGNKYSRLVSDGSARRRFVIGTISFLRKYGFGGLHFDWNYPTCWQSDCKKGPSTDKANFAKLIQELKIEFDKQSPPLVLSAAISGYKEVIDVAYDFSALGNSLDFMSVMTYDYHGAWERQTGHVSPLYGRAGDKYPQYNTNYTMEYLVSLGAPREKLLLGIPFYGQTFTLSKKNTFETEVAASGPGQGGEYTKQPGMLAYYEICDRIKTDRWNVNCNNLAAGCYSYNGDQWVSYENTESVKEKAYYIKSKGFGGAVAWTIDLDDFNNRCCGGSFPLLRSINKALGLIVDKSSPEDCTKPPQPSTPAPPHTTMGVDSGAISTTEHHHHEGNWTSEETTISLWWSTTTSKKPDTTSPWWPTTGSQNTTYDGSSHPSKPSTTPSTTNPWWQSIGHKPNRTSTVGWSTESNTSTTKPTTTSSWWQSTHETSNPTSRKPSSKPTTSSATYPWWESTSYNSSPPSTTTPWWDRTTTKPSTTSIPWWISSTSTKGPDLTTPTHPSKPPGVTIIPNPAHERPEQSNKSCESGQYLPDPANCNAFYRCVMGELRKQYCAGGLHWNRDANVCDWPTQARCEEAKPLVNKEPHNKITTTTKSQTKTTPSRYTSAGITPSPILQITTEIIQGQESHPQNGSERCNTGSYYPHEQCSHFYICFNEALVPQRCAPGLSFSTETGMCDWSFKVKCLGRKVVSQKYTLMYTMNKDLNQRPQPYSSCDGTMFAPYPGDCTKYMDCQWGKYEIRKCAPGLHWNNDKNICDWPDSAQCKTYSNNEVDGSIMKPTTAASELESSTMTSQPELTSTLQWKPLSTTQSTTSMTTEPSNNEWEWHPPIPPTSEKPPLSEPLKPFSGYFKIVCYFTNWAWYRQGAGKYLPEDIDENLCTHIVYGFAVLDYSNHIIKAHDSWADFDNQFYKRVTAYKAKGVKVSIAIGGWNDSQGDKYSKLVNNPAARKKFIDHVLKFLEKNNFDGLDLDWEYPKCWQVDCKKGPDSDKQAFAAFVTELKQAFLPKGYLLSAAVSPSKTVIDAGYDVPVLAKNLDWIAVMTYDFHGQWDKKTGHVAPLFYHPEDDVSFFNANFSINYWISEGVPRRKIVMGMPLYGQSFRLEKESENGLNAKAPGPGEAGPNTRAAGFLAYYEICDNIKNKGWTVVQDPNKRMGPYAYKGNQWVSFDDKNMIKRKSEFIRSLDIGGGMIWALDLDDFKNKCGEGRHPLLTIIRNILANPGNGQQGLNAVPTYQTNENERPTIGSPESVELEVTQKPTPPSVNQSTQNLLDVKSEFKVVCYFTNWAWYRPGVGKYLPSDIDPDLCSHIVYGFAVLNGDELVIKPHDSWADFDNRFYEKITALRAKGIKVLIAIGGWNDSAGDKYSKLVNNASARRKFIAHVIDFIQENNFDGLDLDWEYPKCWQVDCNKGPDSDKPAFVEFVKELHEAFQPKGWLLSSAVSPSKKVIDAGYDVPALSTFLDWIAVMCYDYHGQWDKITGHVAPMYPHPEDFDDTFNVNFSINYWIEKGADRKKLVLGMPTYGQSFSLADNSNYGLNAATYGGGEAGEETRARGFLAYYEICQNVLKKGWEVVMDREGRIGPYAHLRDQWVSFDDIGMIRYKSEYIKAMGLGGGMVWALDLDDFKNLCGCEEYPLLRTINRVLRGYSKPAPKCILGKSEKNPIRETTLRPPIQEPVKTPDESDETTKPCGGTLFSSHPTNCNQYYFCNQGNFQIQSCPVGLFWNINHCDWPENTQCHPDGSTTAPLDATTTEEHVPTIEGTTENFPEVENVHKPSGTEPLEQDGRYKVVCYFTNWAWYRQGDGKYLPSDIDTELCTHINYGFAVLDSNSLTIKPHDTWADIDNQFYKKVTQYKTKGIKVLIAIGGWNDSLGDKYSRLVNNPEARARFIANVILFIEKWGFDGLDLDWEYPKCWQVDCNKGPNTDKEEFANLVRELSAAFKPKGLLLSSAVSPSKAVIDAGYDVPVLNEYFDWIAVMTYDFHGHWDRQTGHVAPLFYYPGDTYDYFNANFSLNYWIEKGASPRKLVMGMPLYGQSFTLADTGDRGLNAKSYGPGEAGEFTRAGGFLAYYEICERVKKKEWSVTRDPEGRLGPYATHANQWVSYDDISEIKRKSQLIKELGLGGGMVWALDLDDFRNKCGCGRHPLLKTLNTELRGIHTDIRLKNCT